MLCDARISRTLAVGVESGINAVHFLNVRRRPTRLAKKGMRKREDEMVPTLLDLYHIQTEMIIVFICGGRVFRAKGDSH